MKAKQTEMYVVHSTPDQRKVVFSSYGPAFKCFKETMKKKLVSVALWHKKGRWTKLQATPYYPESLTEPYLYESYKVQS